jgi:hypothetical protein
MEMVVIQFAQGVFDGDHASDQCGASLVSGHAHGLADHRRTGGANKRGLVFCKRS